MRPDSPSVASFIATLPKVELHLHLVGSASLDTVLRLARRHPGGPVPTDREKLRELFAFTDFAHFLDTYRRVNLLVVRGEDVRTLLAGLAGDLAAHAVRYAEVQVTPLSHRSAGIADDDLAQALVDGRDQALRSHGLELAWIFDADAALGPAGADATVDFALRQRPAGTVGIGLGGPEQGIRRGDFAAAFRRARDAGLRRVPHAGETVGPPEVWAAVDDLGADRIGHGLGAVSDPRLLDHLAHRGIALELCPTSNLRTGAVPTLDAHPLPALVAAGVPVTLATDDPGMFGTDLSHEYQVCHEHFGMGVDGLAEIARTGARAAFCDDDLRARLTRDIDRAVARQSGRATPDQ